ncbi:MAG: hydroxyethylthiazole kinase [Candidatus Altiarchaeota archaeon]
MKQAAEIYKRIGEQKPLVHHLTNWVTISDCAQITRSFGALPVMAHAIDEVEEMVGIASALVLNIGTLTPELIDSMILAGKAANEKGTPVVLDAVGVGATKLRTESATKIIEEVKVSVLKGNAGEIGVLAGVDAEVRGVESMRVAEESSVIASELAGTGEFTVAISGATDVVSDGKRTFLVGNGHKLMGEVVGTGCMAASVIGSFCAVEKDTSIAATAALACYGIAGELASHNARGPGSFKANLFDEASFLTTDVINEKIKVTLE